MFSTSFTILVYMMIGPVAMCAGGAQPPPDPPHRLSSQCESAPMLNLRRKGQKKAKRAAHGKTNVRLEERDEMLEAIGPRAEWYDSAIKIHTRNICDPFYDSWSEIPCQQRAQIERRIADWFNLDYSCRDGLFHRIVERDAKKCYKDWKNDLLDHFEEVGGLKDLAAAKKRPPDNLRDASHWEHCCDRFASAEFLAKSERNKKNCGKQRWVSLHGRRSYTQRNAKKTNTETQESISETKKWEECHRHGDRRVNPEAEHVYNRIEKQRQTQMDQSILGSSTTAAQVDEKPILEQVLGKRRGHRTGVRPTLPHIGSGRVREAQSGEPSSNVHGDVDVLMDRISLLRDVTTRLAPNVRLPPIQPSIPPSESSAATHDNNDDEEDVA